MLPDVAVDKQGLDRVLGIDTSPPESSSAVEKFGDERVDPGRAQCVRS